MDATNHITQISLAIFDTAPANHITFEVLDGSCLPLIKPGETVVVDLAAWEPEDGQLHLCRFTNGNLAIKEACLSPRHRENPQRWWLKSHNRPKSTAECLDWMQRGNAHAFADGPYRASGKKRLGAIGLILGRVVGILQPQGQIGPRKGFEALVPSSPACGAKRRSTPLLIAN